MAAINKNDDVFSFDDFLKVLQQEGRMPAAKVVESVERLRKTRQEQQRREEEAARKRREEEALRKQQEEEAEKRRIADITSMELPMDWENLFAGDVRAEGVHADSISDGMILSLTELGVVDMEYIAAVTGENLKTVICALKGSVFQNPETWEECFYKGWETAEQYLSGNMVGKWKAAREANKKYNGYFDENVKAIEKVLPPAVSTEDIYITIGSPWVPTHVIDEFIRHILNIRGNCYACTSHDTYTGTWEIENKSTYKHRVPARTTYGTEKMPALQILERTLNMKSVTVMTEVRSYTNKSGKKRVVDQAETVAALEKQQKMIAEFKKWVWKDPKRRAELEQIFDDNFGSHRKRYFDGSFLRFPTMSPEVQLYPYQKNAVARILFSPNTLLAHDVGSGKTFIMIAAGMELRRMGLSKKNLYVVPNNLVGQWENIFYRLYPKAKVLTVEPKSFTPDKRAKVLETIRDNEYDGIIMAYSCFEEIDLSRDYILQELERTREEIRKLLTQSRKTSNKLRRKAKSVDEAICEAVTCAMKSCNSVCFDELGISRLFVDEAHNFKNVPLDTKIDRVLGISTTGSKKCQDMLDKVRMIQKCNGGGGVVMATGTPITNSITDAFIMQQYLQSGELALLDLQSFDSWVGMFAERVTEFEIDVDTGGYRLATRFARFHNLPELTTLLSSVADFHQVCATDEVPETDGYSDTLVFKTEEFSEYLKTITQRAETVRAGLVERTEDNMLKITTDGRKAALDLRLVQPQAAMTPQSKAEKCANNVYEIYTATAERKSTQLIFCDSSTPKKGFNIYDEVHRLLTEKGIPPEQMAYIHNADTEKKRQSLFTRVQKGEVRILFGSTFKLGLGVNVQDKLIAVHHLDIPWRPADMTQREGRILRQGNENKKVYIFRYITEGSFDAYSWQLLETKQRFIAELLSGSMDQRSGSDIESTVLDYAEVKALAVGNPLVKLRVEAANELTRLLTLQRKTVESRIAMEKELMELPGLMTHQQQLIEKCREDRAFVESTPVTKDPQQRKVTQKEIFDAVQTNVLEVRERELLVYRGFRVILPANMSETKPYLWLQREGRYYVELGEAEGGYLTRMDNVLKGLDDHEKKLEENLQEMQLRQKGLQEELARDEDYTDLINKYKSKLKKLDKQLGVENDG
ncbi:MAG: DEAD/DEAH box helicase family protein [Oscillospiraceae bacterium]|nr:DEAD/DEAH box helicase family protein [Oscillospiraceae bacterium]